MMTDELYGESACAVETHISVAVRANALAPDSSDIRFAVREISKRDAGATEGAHGGMHHLCGRARHPAAPF